MKSFSLYYTFTNKADMRFLIFITLALLIIGGCSSEDESNPVDTDKSATGFVRGYVNGSYWYSNKITTSKSNNTRIVKATLDSSNDPIYKSSVLEFRIRVNQAGEYGIGEDEPGLNYVVKAYYTLASRNGSEDKFHKAHYDNVSTLTISAISDKNLDADFLFNAVTDDSSSAVVFTNGAIQIDF
jgi:hypothetical protein